jgi:tagatose 6-phosphate kinase
VILSAGLTPALQQILVFDAFRCGQVNRAREVHWCTSGKVFNAGIAVHHLGGPSLTLAPVGGPPRELIGSELDDLELPCRLLATQAATRVCTTIIDRTSDTITELVENGRPLAPSELRMFRKAYAEEAAKADVAILIGSLPTGTPVSFYRELVERTRCRAVLDFRDEGLMSVLDLKPYLVKPNREELARTLGRPVESDDELLAAMQSLNQRGAQWVVTTQGSQPVWVSSATEAYRVYPLPVDEIVNSIGCGDVMAAGLAWATRDGRNAVEAVRVGIAAAAENLRHLLPGRLDRKRVLKNAERVRVERVR